MPKWGLTLEMRDAGAYDIPSGLLEPAKTITDPIHGDIYLLEIERMLIDTKPFQRLRRVRQLGNSHLVYPSATHTRFSHSLGALRAAQDLLDIVIDQRSARKPVADLFSEWTANEDTFLRRIAEATILTRLGALLHDFCHVPFGHSIEDELRVLDAHDENLPRFETLWSQIDPEIREVIENGISAEGRSLFEDLRPIILSKNEEVGGKPAASEEDVPPVPDISYPFAADIVGNTISADLIDYLNRDHAFTGLPAALGHRFLDGFYVIPANHREYPQRMAIRVRRADGSERRDAISELLKYLRFRYELSERALVHHTKLSADAMIGKTLEMYNDALWIDKAREQHPNLQADPSDISSFKSHFRVALSARQADAISDAVKAEIEDLFLSHGDDGLLEYLYSTARKRSADDRRWAAIESLIDSLLQRKLFKRIALTSNNDDAKHIFEQWGDSPEKRRNLERSVARAAEVKPAWWVVAWIPPPTMRLKAALVLVDDNGKIRSFVKREVSNPRHRGEDIYNAHMDLWAVSVFVEPTVAKGDLRDRIVARMAEILSVDAWDSDMLPTSLRDVAVDAVSSERDLKYSERNALQEAVGVDYYGGRDSDDLTYEQHCEEVRLISDGISASTEGATGVTGADEDDNDPPRLL